MATRSNVGIINEDGTVEVIYVHWDGYPQHVGVLLETLFHEDKTRELLAGGNRSSLLDTENAQDGESRKYESFEEYALADKCGAEYVYLAKSEGSYFNWYSYKIEIGSEELEPLGILKVKVSFEKEKAVA
jgi:hypothetical protein